jgi:hypothetical protein
VSLRLQRALCALATVSFGSVAWAQSQPFAPAQSPAPPTAQSSAPAAPVNTLVDTHARLQWLLVENLGAGSVLDDVGVGAVDTFFKTPKEYGTHWEGFGERIGQVTANYALKSTMEVGLGSIWGEDPRYFRTTGLSVKSRMAYVIKMTFVARNREGNDMPAYSRFVAFPASSFIANGWAPRSESSANDAIIRAGLGFLSRMGENAWKEFIVPRH